MSGKKKLYFIAYKPFRVLSQFTDEGENRGLSSVFQLPKDVYPVGRLDLDSEGLLLLTNDKTVNHQLLNPNFEHKRTYWVEVEGIPNEDAFEKLRNGVQIKLKRGLYQTKPSIVRLIKSLDQIPSRKPAVNHLKYKETCWIEIILTEGKNRQVRKMTASIGHPTLRLIRVAIEDLKLFPMNPGEITQVSERVIKTKLRLS